MNVAVEILIYHFTDTWHQFMPSAVGTGPEVGIDLHNTSSYIHMHCRQHSRRLYEAEHHGNEMVAAFHKFIHEMMGFRLISKHGSEVLELL